MTTSIKRARYSVSLVLQGKHRFYTLTVPSNILAQCCFVSLRDEEPDEGFQRRLDIRRAQEIAEYVDGGFGTIPNSVVLSAQPAAKLKDVGQGKTIEFSLHPKAFLIIDGQHRVFGYKIAKTALRVPVVIYNGLSRSDEARLFIDVNTKQRPVPTELLLDIKRLAKAESQSEALYKDVFDMFDRSSDSALAGLTSRSTRSKGKVSRVTFNPALKALVPIFSEPEADKIYGSLNPYLHAVRAGLKELDLESELTRPTVFKAFMAIFKDVAQKTADRFGRKYTVENFSEVLESTLDGLSAKTFKSFGASYNELADLMRKRLARDFSI